MTELSYSKPPLSITFSNDRVNDKIKVHIRNVYTNAQYSGSFKEYDIHEGRLSGASVVAMLNHIRTKLKEDDIKVSVHDSYCKIECYLSEHLTFKLNCKVIKIETDAEKIRRLENKIAQLQQENTKLERDCRTYRSAFPSSVYSDVLPTCRGCGSYLCEGDCESCQHEPS